MEDNIEEIFNEIVNLWRGKGKCITYKSSIIFSYIKVSSPTDSALLRIKKNKKYKTKNENQIKEEAYNKIGSSPPVFQLMKFCERTMNRITEKFRNLNI